MKSNERTVYGHISIEYMKMVLCNVYVALHDNNVDK